MISIPGKAVLLSSLFVLLAQHTPQTLAARALGSPGSAAAKAEARVAYGTLPLSFEVNRGQANGEVKFLSRGSGYTLFLTSSEAVLSVVQPTTGESTDTPGPRARGQDVLRLRLLGANPSPEIAGVEELPGKSNYLRGSDAKKWQTDISTFAKVRYEGVYPGIDVVYYGNQGRLEYDFLLAPGVDPSTIRFRVEGADPLRLDSNGDLILRMTAGQMVLHAPIIYQANAGNKTNVSGRYVLVGEDEVAFELAPHDDSLPLIIDPQLSYATYLGGSLIENSTFESDIAVQPSGHVYVTGDTASAATFPVTPGPRAYGGGTTDVFVTKLHVDANGNVILVYSTFLGGMGTDSGLGIAVDNGGNAYVTGSTTSFDFPTTVGAYQIAHQTLGLVDAFITKLNPAGSGFVYSTYLGGQGIDVANDIAVDSEGNVYVTGTTSSDPDNPFITAHFPTTVGAYQESKTSVWAIFVSKLNSTGAALVYSTYYDGTMGQPGQESATGIAVDVAGNAYVTGYTDDLTFPTLDNPQRNYGGGLSDAFVVKFGPNGLPEYSTFLGGTFGDIGNAIAVDPFGTAGFVYVTGSALSFNSPNSPLFPKTPGTGNCLGTGFVTKLRTDGEGPPLVYSTRLCGSSGRGISVDATGHAFVADQVRPAQNAPADVNVTRLDPEGLPALSISFGGSTTDDASGVGVDASGSAYVTGYTRSDNFPQVNNQLVQIGFGGGPAFFEIDAFVAKVDFCSPPPPGMVSLWPFDGNTLDSLAANSGILEQGASPNPTPFPNGHVSAISPPIGRSLSFDGMDDRVAIPHSTSLRPEAGGFTIETWIRALNPQLDTNPAIVTQAEGGGVGSSDSGGLYDLSLDSSGNLVFRVRDSLNTVNVVNRNLTASLIDGEFHHVAGVRDVINGFLRAYVDGVEILPPVLLTATGTITDDDMQNDPVVIGARRVIGSDSVDSHFKGEIDEVGFFNRALSAAEIWNIFNAGADELCRALADTDKDRIDDYVDTLIDPSLPNDSFSDIALGGDTTGTITRGNPLAGFSTRDWLIVDEPDDSATTIVEGVRILVGPGSGPAKVFPGPECSPDTEIEIISDDGAEFVFSCGSTEVRVFFGLVRVELVSAAVSVDVGPEGALRFIELASGAVEAKNTGDTELVVNGQTLQPNESTTVGDDDPPPAEGPGALCAAAFNILPADTTVAFERSWSSVDDCNLRGNSTNCADIKETHAVTINGSTAKMCMFTDGAGTPEGDTKWNGKNVFDKNDFKQASSTASLTARNVNDLKIKIKIKNRVAPFTVAIVVVDSGADDTGGDPGGDPGGGPGAPVVIKKAEFKASKGELKVQAFNNEAGGPHPMTVSAELLGDIGVMTAKGSTYQFKKQTADPGATVTVTSDTGESDTLDVKHK